MTESQHSNGDSDWQQSRRRFHRVAIALAFGYEVVRRRRPDDKAIEKYTEALPQRLPLGTFLNVPFLFGGAVVGGPLKETSETLVTATKRPPFHR